MGLTYSSTSKKSLKDLFNVEKSSEDDLVVALAGNPNTGKSTVFNSLTGLHQHTGNWPGKTVTNTQGKYSFIDKNFIVVDLPGTYSLLASSIEEIVARDFICFGRPDVTVVVLDSTCIERNFNLLLQIMEITPRVVVCLNLMDEAKKKNIKIDVTSLEERLGVPIVPSAARSNKGMDNLKEKIYDVSLGNILPIPRKIAYRSEITNMICELSPKLKKIFGNNINTDWLALRLLDGDKSILDSISKYLNTDINIY